MAITTVSAGKDFQAQESDGVLKEQISESIGRLSDWLEKNDYRGYDAFDGLNARFVRPLTFETTFLRTVLQQGVRRFPLNTRPLLGVRKSYSTKGMGFLAKGFIRLHQATGDEAWARKAEFALEWLIENQSKGYSGACWGNHFDYQSRTFYLPKGVPTIVWTSLIGHAFLDAYDHFQKEKYLQIAVSACEHGNLEAKLPHRRRHSIDGSVVLARISNIRNQLLDGPELNLHLVCHLVVLQILTPSPFGRRTVSRQHRGVTPLMGV